LIIKKLVDKVQNRKKDRISTI